MKNFIKEFKEFAIKGNMIDMAVGIIIGGTFSTIVKSLVDNIFMPIISLIAGKRDFSNMFIALDGNTYKSAAAAEEVGAALIRYGQFITDIINFVLLLFVVFLFVKSVNKLREAKAARELAVQEEPAEKECPYCFTKINIKATKCPSCTADLTEGN